MTTRPLDLLDLPALYRHRDEAICLDTARLLTRGAPLGAMGFLSYFNPARHLYAAVAEENENLLLGGISQSSGDDFARLLYLTPQANLTHPSLPALLEMLSAEAGLWGAFHVLAEVDEESPAIPALRRAGFSVYAWQRVWDLSEISSPEAVSSWQKIRPIQIPALQNLFHQIVPPLLHPIESLPRRAEGLICSENEKCYVGINQGARGLWLMPLIHPEASAVAEKLASLLAFLPQRRSRPVYLCVRSYQAWLESTLQDLGAKPGPRQAVMVKHLARKITMGEIRLVPELYKDVGKNGAIQPFLPYKIGKFRY
ncbi:MAG: hypothetical protein CO094_03405 [Anaerolineae bacterium CG_4_9_14_3_um_filter_57_17]|nr:hypothetical protein [bacterium]NCT20702.1 hypothetical protein [bacterium]OIO86130.1 MAG: hypothetical protein AUK01_04140 [Anaerolineae bacterium CG2_30_57_67]PJB67692.1 MAG: hypothetical protein CO094_03405 [Anaerolineae bacterium CG_4_9_14_3_um_filter_57_17]